jgi:hypothetical protein
MGIYSNTKEQGLKERGYLHAEGGCTTTTNELSPPSSPPPPSKKDWSNSPASLSQHLASPAPANVQHHVNWTSSSQYATSARMSPANLDLNCTPSDKEENDVSMKFVIQIHTEIETWSYLIHTETEISDYLIHTETKNMPDILSQFYLHKVPLKYSRPLVSSSSGRCSSPPLITASQSF